MEACVVYHVSVSDGLHLVDVIAFQFGIEHLVEGIEKGDNL